MSAAKLILGDNDTYEFDFNDLTSATLLDGFTIPPAELNERGLRRRERGERPRMEDYNRITIQICFKLQGTANIESLLTKQRTLLMALGKGRNVLTWNPDPATCSDVYFDTYASPLDLPLDIAYFIQSKGTYTLNLLADPFPYPAESTIFDTVAVLGQVDGESGEWTASNETGANAPEDSTKYRQGSKSARTEIKAGANSWIQRDATSILKYSPLGATNWITVCLWFDEKPTNLQADGFRIRIGNDSTHYFRYDFDKPYGESAFHAGWQLLFFDFAAPSYILNGSTTGNDYFYFEANVASGDGPAFNIDNVHSVNGKVCNVRGQTPLAITVYDVGGEYDCGFKADLQAGANMQTLIAGEDSEAGQWSATGAGDSATLLALSNFTPPPDTFGPHSGVKFVQMHNYCGTTSTFKREMATGLDCAGLSLGKVSFWLRCMELWSIVTFAANHLEIHIGKDSSNYFKYVFGTVAQPSSAGWVEFKFNVADMSTGAGTPSWADAVKYIAVKIAGSDGSQGWGIDDMVIYEPGSSIDLMTITEGSGIEASLDVISIPEATPTAPTGHTWEATPAATALAETYGGKYYGYTTAATYTAEKYMFPGKLAGDLYPGEHNIQVRLRTSDAAGGAARLCGYDAYSGEWSFGETVTIGYNAGHFQTIDLGSLTLPFDGWHRDATSASMYSILGVAITQATNAAKNWDINVLIPAPIEGGGRHFTPVVGQRYSCFDTRYIDSEIYSQGPAPGANYMSGARRRTVGDLLTLQVGVNNLLINASDSSAPDSCSSIELMKLSTVHRLKNGAP